jgi:peptide-methionine (S)-S-oxide reductase
MKTFIRFATLGLSFAMLQSVPFQSAWAADLSVTPTAPNVTQSDSIVLAGGCFWGMQAVFQHVKGVTQATAGYAGGDAETAHYDQVSTGTTGHAESVQIVYDPKQVSLDRLLDIYFKVAHDPTELNYQGPDHGSQYRSAIFYRTPEQEKMAQADIAQMQKDGSIHGSIVTKLEPLKNFYAAEEYHQNYATLHPDNGYIATFDLPKVAALQKEFPQDYVK